MSLSLLARGALTGGFGALNGYWVGGILLIAIAGLDPVRTNTS
jgi:hypothetical protein